MLWLCIAFIAATVIILINRGKVSAALFSVSVTLGVMVNYILFEVGLITPNYLYFEGFARDAVWYGVLSSLGCLIGASAYKSRYSVRDRNIDVEDLFLYAYKFRIHILLVAIAITVIALGPQNMIDTRIIDRGSGQFDAKSNNELIIHYALIFSQALLFTVFTIWAAGMLKGRLRVKSIVFTLLIALLCALPLMQKFSRGSGIFFLILCVIFLVRRERSLLLSTICFCIFVWLHIVGLGCRGVVPSGAGNFVVSAVIGQCYSASGEYNYSFISGLTDFLYRYGYMFSSLEPTTAAMAVHESQMSPYGIFSPAVSIFRFIYIVSPVPSVFLDSDMLSVGGSLSIALGTDQSGTGITTPLVGELYLLFGWIGILFFVLFGYFLTKIEVKCSRDRFMIAAFYCTIVSISLLASHSGIRATSRIVVFFVVLYMISYALSAMRSRYIRQRRFTYKV